MKHLTDQTMLGSIAMKNRFVRAAVGDPTKGGHLTESNFELYQKLAEGGAALLISGFSVVDAQEQSDHTFSMADDALIPEYQRLTQTVHESGSKIAAQLVYLSGFVPVPRPLAPSAGKNKYTGIETFEMTEDEIRQMVRLFADAARAPRRWGSTVWSCTPPTDFCTTSSSLRCGTIAPTVTAGQWRIAAASSSKLTRPFAKPSGANFPL